MASILLHHITSDTLTQQQTRKQVPPLMCSTYSKHGNTFRHVSHRCSAQLLHHVFRSNSWKPVQTCYAQVFRLASVLHHVFRSHSTAHVLIYTYFIKTTINSTFFLPVSLHFRNFVSFFSKNFTVFHHFSFNFKIIIKTGYRVFTISFTHNITFTFILLDNITTKVVKNN